MDRSMCSAGLLTEDSIVVIGYRGDFDVASHPFVPGEEIKTRTGLQSDKCKKLKTNTGHRGTHTTGGHLSLNQSNPYFICIHLSTSKSYQLSITDSPLSTVG